MTLGFVAVAFIFGEAAMTAQEIIAEIGKIDSRSAMDAILKFAKSRRNELKATVLAVVSQYKPRCIVCCGKCHKRTLVIVSQHKVSDCECGFKRHLVCPSCGKGIKCTKWVQFVRYESFAVSAILNGRELIVTSCSPTCRDKAHRKFECVNKRLQEEKLKCKQARLALTGLRDFINRDAKKSQPRESAQPATSLG